MVENYAPGAPQAIRDEACIRIVGYLVNSDYGGFRKEPTSVGGQDGGEYVTNHAPAFRNSRRRDAAHEVEDPPGRGGRLGALAVVEGRARGASGAGEARGRTVHGCRGRGVAPLKRPVPGPATRAAIAALEAAAGLYAAAFAGARVTPDNPMTAALTPGCRALIARDLIRRGESVHRIRIEGGMVRLQPIGSWDVRGAADERYWFYRLDEYGPSSNTTNVVSGMSLVHCRYAVDSARPWYGLAPLQWARATGTLAANLEVRLGEEASAAVGFIMPVPADGGDGGDDDPLKLLKADLAAGEGAHDPRRDDKRWLGRGPARGAPGGLEGPSVRSLPARTRSRPFAPMRPSQC